MLQEIISRQEEFDALYSKACSFVVDRIIDYYENVVDEPLPEQTEMLVSEGCELKALIECAEELEIELTGLEIPYKMIILHDGECNSLEDWDKVESLLTNENSIPEDMIAEYIVCRNKEELIEEWEKNLKQYEGAWYGIKDIDDLLLGGSYDPNDIEDIEQYPSYIPEYTMEARVKGILYKDSDEAAHSADLGDLFDGRAIEFPSEKGKYETMVYFRTEVQAYTISGAKAKAIDALGKADYGELKDVQVVSGFEIKKLTADDKKERAAALAAVKELQAGDIVAVNLNGNIEFTAVVLEPADDYGNVNVMFDPANADFQKEGTYIESNGIGTINPLDCHYKNGITRVDLPEQEKIRMAEEIKERREAFVESFDVKENDDLER